MHPRFAERIANQIHQRKWKLGWKPPTLAKWVTERFPNLTQEDQAQIASYIPKQSK